MIRAWLRGRWRREVSRDVIRRVLHVLEASESPMAALDLAFVIGEAPAVIIAAIDAWRGRVIADGWRVVEVLESDVPRTGRLRRYRAERGDA